MKKIILIIAFFILTDQAWAGSGCSFFTDQVDVTPSTSGMWTDVDVSSYVAEDATGAILRIHNASNSSKAAAVRKNGSTDTRGGLLTQWGHFGAMVGLDSNKKFEAYIGDSNAKIYLIGYTSDGTNFFTNSINVTPGASGDWVDVDVSAYVPFGATGVILELINNTGDATAYQAGIRNNGSTDTFTYCYPGTYNRHFYQVCGVDSNRVFEAKVEDTSGVRLWLVGYFKSPVTFETNAVSYALSSTGSWLDITVSSGNAPSNADGALWLIKNSDNSNSRSGGIRKEGSGDSSYNDLVGSACVAFFTGLDSSRVAEGNIDNLAVDHYVIGYAQPVTPQPAKIQNAQIQNATIQ